jgi:hypothetical protein
MKSLAPIALFTFKRLDTLIQTVEALQKNDLASNSDLIVFSDAARNEQEQGAVVAVRKYLATITGFRSIVINESMTNKGLANSIISGVTSILQQYGKIIVLEDDLLTSTNFLSYMNQALDFYKIKSKVFSITGFSIPLDREDTKTDVYFTLRSSSWGWATWNDRWENIDWTVSEYSNFKNNRELRSDFNKMGSDMAQMLDRQMSAKINSWAIRWCYHQFNKGLFSVHPFISKVQNIGFNSVDASNTNEKYSRYNTTLDMGTTKDFHFSESIKLKKEIIKQFVAPYSIINRIKYKLINSVFKF